MTNKNSLKNVDDVMSRKNRRHGLLPMKKALEEIGNPEKDLRIVHIAGTNGKGSTVNYLKDILVISGYKVATFTSPHLVSHYDRIRINDEWIKEKSFNYYLKKYKDIIEKYDLGMFEIDLLIALSYFARQKVDYMLMETGLGGRLDYTNAIDNKMIEVITSIGIDHTDFLGERLEQIAYEKAGIIKKYSTIVLGSKINDKALRIIKIQADKKHANLIKNKYRKTGKYSFIFDEEEYEITGARYQKNNAALALEVAKVLGINIKSDKVKKAIKTSMWAGRFEKLKDKPNIIVDGAHNLEGALALKESIHDLPKPIITVFASLKDKPGNEMLKLLGECSDEIIVTEFDNPRIRFIEDYDGYLRIKDYREAINIAISKAENGSVVITGSLYFISLVREEIKNMGI